MTDTTSSQQKEFSLPDYAVGPFSEFSVNEAGGKICDSFAQARKLLNGNSTPERKSISTLIAFREDQILKTVMGGGDPTARKNNTLTGQICSLMASVNSLPPEERTQNYILFSKFLENFLTEGVFPLADQRLIKPVHDVFKEIACRSKKAQETANKEMPYFNREAVRSYLRGGKTILQELFPSGPS